MEMGVEEGKKVLYREEPFIFPHDKALLHEPRSTKKCFSLIGVEELSWNTTRTLMIEHQC